MSPTDRPRSTVSMSSQLEPASAPKPVLMFVHEGAFIAGDKHAAGSPFLDNIMLWAVKNGFVGVNVNYRLAPQSVWPSGPEDMAAAIQWVSQNIRARGGDPSRIYLMGHSAGAVHVASYISHPEFHGMKAGGLAGAILISGVYQLGPNPEGVYFGNDPALYPERSSLQGLLKSPIPLMIASAELDPPRFIEQFNLLEQETCKLPRGCVRAIALPQHSHMSEVYSINTSDTRLTDQILDFVKTGR